jgi:CubicO group peptidase (beta-lactamase class C family)
MKKLLCLLILVILLIPSITIIPAEKEGNNIVYVDDYVECIRDRTKEGSSRLIQDSINTATIQPVDLMIQLLMRISKVPSLSACLIRNNTIIWSKGYGLYDIEHKKTATDKTLYNIASISKTVTATAILQLYEKSLIDLDDDIDNYLPFSVRHPQYPDIPITFKMLLSHQSGLSEDPENFYKYFPPDRCHIPLYPWIETYLNPQGNNYTSKIWSDDAPGETFHYANIGFALIGYLVEAITGQSFHQYCKDNIFIPLKMHNTSYILSDINLSNLAIPYQFRFIRYIPYGHYCYIGYPCGSIQTSVTELSHFIIAHMNQGKYEEYQLLNATTIQLMHTVQYPDGDYGLGWVIWNNTDNEHFYGHTGGDYGVSTSVTVRVSDNTSVIYFANGEPLRPIQIKAWGLIENILFSLS